MFGVTKQHNVVYPIQISSQIRPCLSHFFLLVKSNKILLSFQMINIMKIIQYFFLACLLLFIVLVLHNNLIDDAQSSVVSSDRSLNVELSQEDAARPDISKEIIITGQLALGDTFSSALRRDAVPDNIRLFIVNTLSDSLDFKRLKPNDSYTVTLNASGDLELFRYNSSPLDSISISRLKDSYKVQRDPIELVCNRVRISGSINSSLYLSFTDKNEDMRLVFAFADIFASQIDFNTEVREGDRYSLVVDKYYKADEFVGYGKIQVATYQFANGKAFEAYLYVPSGEQSGAYFDRNGQAVGTSFLKSPLPFARISSKFSYRRKHPVTGRVQPHLGVDLAAPAGTPIMAAADGVISFIGRNGGNGKQVIIRHSGGYKTYYGHLSRFEKGLHGGDQVAKKAIIGYVGATGIATGPHLDYRIEHNGLFKNPFSIEFKPKKVLTKQQIAEFKREMQAIESYCSSKEDVNETTLLNVSQITLSSANEITLL